MRSNEIDVLAVRESELQIEHRISVTASPWSTTSADFDQDGNIDYLFATPGTLNNLGSANLWRGLPQGIRSEASTYKVGKGTYAVAARPNGGPEEIIAAAASYTDSILLPLIAHRGAMPTSGTSKTLTFKPTALQFGLNRGGADRLFVVGSTDTAGAMIVFDVQGPSLNQLNTVNNIGSNPNDVQLGDLNEDGLLDAVIVDDSTKSHLYAVICDAKATCSTTSQLDVPASSHAVALLDIDHDGHLDVAVISGTTSTIDVCFGTGTGSFQQCETVPHSLKEPTDIAAGDLDADGWADFVVIGYEGLAERIRVMPESSQ